MDVFLEFSQKFLEQLCQRTIIFSCSAGPILERKGMCAIFQKKGQKRAKYFEKGHMIACDYCTE